MVNRYNNKKRLKKGTKKTKKRVESFVESFPNLFRPSCVCVFVVKGWLGGIERWKGRSVG